MSAKIRCTLGKRLLAHLPLHKKSAKGCEKQTGTFPVMPLAASLVLAFFFFGCSPLETQPLSGQVRAGLGSIGVTASPRPPEIRIIAIPSGLIKGAAQGAGGAVVSAVRGCLDFDPTGICVVVLLIFSPYIAAGGAIHGLLAVQSEKHVRASRESIAAAFAGQDYRRPLLEGVHGTARNVAGGRGMIVLAPSAPGPSGGAGERLREKLPETDSLLHLRLMEVSLGQRPAVDPLLRLHITIQWRLIRTRHPAEIFSGILTYSSVDRHGFIQWGERDAFRLRNALNRGLQRLGERIVALLFPAAASLESP